MNPQDLYKNQGYPNNKNVFLGNVVFQTLTPYPGLIPPWENPMIVGSSGIYVSPNGSDVVGGGGIGDPYKTIAFALSQINSGLPPVALTSIILYPGIYSEAPITWLDNVNLSSLNGDFSTTKITSTITYNSISGSLGVKFIGVSLSVNINMSASGNNGSFSSYGCSISFTQSDTTSSSLYITSSTISAASIITGTNVRLSNCNIKSNITLQIAAVATVSNSIINNNAQIVLAGTGCYIATIAVQSDNTYIEVPGTGTTWMRDAYSSNQITSGSILTIIDVPYADLESNGVYVLNNAGTSVVPIGLLATNESGIINLSNSGQSAYSNINILGIQGQSTMLTASSSDGDAVCLGEFNPGSGLIATISAQNPPDSTVVPLNINLAEADVIFGVTSEADASVFTDGTGIYLDYTLAGGGGLISGINSGIANFAQGTSFDQSGSGGVQNGQYFEIEGSYNITGPVYYHSGGVSSIVDNGGSITINFVDPFLAPPFVVANVWTDLPATDGYCTISSGTYTTNAIGIIFSAGTTKSCHFRISGLIQLGPSSDDLVVRKQNAMINIENRKNKILRKKGIIIEDKPLIKVQEKIKSKVQKVKQIQQTKLNEIKKMPDVVNDKYFPIAKQDIKPMTNEEKAKEIDSLYQKFKSLFSK